MEKINRVHCFFEQSGTFKNEFIKKGIPAYDYDKQNDFGQTDFEIDLFFHIQEAYYNKSSLFDKISKDDLILAFFPCIHFCDAKGLFFRGEAIQQKNKSLADIMRRNILYEMNRTYFFKILLQFVAVCADRKLRMILENPYSTSGNSYLQCNFLKPTLIDKNRMLRGDFFVKPTAYWFFNCEPTNGFTIQKDKKQKIVMQAARGKQGTCSSERSMISEDYARNFINDFILGTTVKQIQTELTF